MNPFELGEKYDKIALWWHSRHEHSQYGVSQLERAADCTSNAGKALDIGCGAGGRFIRLLEKRGFSITGIDVSKEMIGLASTIHPQHRFIQQDICSWETEEEFDLIYAWDSIFHLPLEMQEPVVTKLSGRLAKGGVLMYTFGNAEGEHTDQWHGDTFYYSSIGINRNMQLLINNGLTLLHLELDQYPEKHVYTIATRPRIFSWMDH
ncbi:methyltransferase type 11 [Chromatiales bacterium (ex Bugula neritina AB1)]|nr:methyltransferase type 11 [Chromatiales bacterium (ex Bugula neritina AB1)]